MKEPTGGGKETTEMDPTIPQPPGMPSFHPETMQAWLYTSTTGTLEKNLRFNPTARTPAPPKGNEVLVQVFTASLNHADYWFSELGLPARLLIGSPASPGMEFCGRVAGTGPLAQHLKEGTLVYGSYGRPTQFGSLAEYVVLGADKLAIVPDGVNIDSAASVSACGLTAYQSLEGNVKEGSNVFVNGGSGGCGIFAIQIAKAMGCRVTVTCSTRNMELCLRIGADEVIDYTAEKDLVSKLVSRGDQFDCIIDNVGSPSPLYYQSHLFLKEKGTFVQVGVQSSRTYLRAVWPAFLGGGQRRYVVLSRVDNPRQLVQLGEWLRDRMVQVQLDGVYEFHDVVKAFEKLRSGHARGKIVVHVNDPHARDMEAFGIGI